MSQNTYGLLITSLPYYIIQPIYILNFVTANIKSMKLVQQISAVVPYGDSVLHTAEGLYGYSLKQTRNAYDTARDRVVATRKNYTSFKRNVESTIASIAQETSNEVLTRLEKLVGVNLEGSGPEAQAQITHRIQMLFQTILQQYVLKSRLLTNQHSQALITYAGQLSTTYLVPMYVTLKASLLVTKEMLIEYLEGLFHDMKLSYESSKDNIVMFVAGSFNEEKIKEKVFEGIQSFRKLTVQVVSKGLEIRVDRQSLMDNYDKFALNFIEVVREMRDKGEGNITEMKKKSRDLYSEVVKRIRAKQSEIRKQLNITELEQEQKAQ